MNLSDKLAYRQIIGCLMKNPLLFLEYIDMQPIDFDLIVARICFVSIKKLYEEGARTLTPLAVDQEIEKHASSFEIYQNSGGLEFLKTSYEFAELENFEMYYNRLKKYSLLRRLRKDKYDITEFFIDDKDVDNPLKEIEIQNHFNESSLEDILNAVESKYSAIRNEYLQGGRLQGDPSEGVDELIEDLKKTPDIGPALEGDIFSSVCRGAREGCFFLKSASTSAGKSRTSIFDACRLAYPERWSHKKNTFIKELIPKTDKIRNPRKVLFIVTEMDKEELQTIMLAYLSGVDEEHILTGKYELGELTRVKFAASIIKKYKGYFLIEEISEPNLVNVESTIKKYAIIDKVKYVFFDYIHSTASMIGQFSKNNIREDVILMMLANQLKQLAKDYNLFIFSATQVNSSAMMDDGQYKNETCIAGSKAVANKIDMGYVMTKVQDKSWNSIIPTLKICASKGLIDASFIEDKDKRPTHIIDIYKMRRGRYKNVRIWIRLHLGTGEREDLFITSPENQPIGSSIVKIVTAEEEEISDWTIQLKGK